LTPDHELQTLGNEKFPANSANVIRWWTLPDNAYVVMFEYYDGCDLENESTPLPMIHGAIRFDGCANLYSDNPDGSGMHFCGPYAAQVILRMYQIAGEQMGQDFNIPALPKNYSLERYNEP